MRPLPFVIVVLTLATGAAAQDAPVTRVVVDLDHDGETKEAALVPGSGSDGSMDLLLGGTTYTDVAWAGGMDGQRASLAVSDEGSLLIQSGNDAVGRDRWWMTVTVVHRGGTLKVGGITYEWSDTLDPDAGGRCDLNLLTGRGVVETAKGGRQEIGDLGPAPLLSEWHEASAALPPACGS